MNAYPKLFSPIKIGETTVKNRVFMPPISTNLAEKGYVTGIWLVEHYAARAKGGVRTDCDRSNHNRAYLCLSAWRYVHL